MGVFDGEVLREWNRCFLGIFVSFVTGVLRRSGQQDTSKSLDSFLFSS